VQIFRLIFCCVLFGFTATAGIAAGALPPKPAHYFNDYAHVVSPQQADALNLRLENFERETSNQLVVAIFPQLPTGAEVFDFSMRAAQSWRVGQKGRDNGAVLFVFVRDHAVQIQIGYGLEGVLPDATCHAIIENEIKPRFRADDYAGGLNAATTAMIAATKGEYRGTGRTHSENQNSNGGGFIVFAIFALIVFLVSIINRRNRAQNTIFGRRRSVFNSGTPGFWGGFGGGSGGGWSGGGGGGFSGGGGSFGGGGSGGSW
jgi:uncharacterized protein